MYIKGTHRHVWIIGPLVFKVPMIWKMIFYLFENIAQAENASKSCPVLDENDWVIKREPVRGLHRLIRFLSLWSKFSRITLRYSNGIAENWRETECYFRTKNHLLARLYLPLIIVNVYHRYDGVGCFRLNGEALCMKLEEYVGDGLSRITSARPWHTFESVNNFAYNKNQVTILDYGEPGFEELLAEYGGTIKSFLLDMAAEDKKDSACPNRQV